MGKSLILPCPFCGKSDAFVERLDSSSSMVICQGMVDEHSACLARGPVGIQDGDGEDQPGYAAAVREWNSRIQRAGAAPEQEPVSWLDQSSGRASKSQSGRYSVPLYTRAYPAEVERKIAERDALLDRVVDHLSFWSDHPYAECLHGVVNDYRKLTASAEPAIPEEIPRVIRYDDSVPNGYRGPAKGGGGEQVE